MIEDRFLRRPEVEAMTGLSRSSIYRLMSSGEFVRPYKIGKAAVRWRYIEVKAWLAGRPPAIGGWPLTERAFQYLQS